MSAATTLTRDYASNADIMSRYEPLDPPEDAVQMTYIWVDGRQGVRNKSKTIDFVPQTLEQVPNWVFGSDWFYNLPELPMGSEIVLQPARLYNDPFNGGDQKIVFCQAVLYGSLEPIPDNTRYSCAQVLDRVKHQDPRFLIEQEYYLFDGNDRHRPLGWPEDGGRPASGAPYYCGVGTDQVSGRYVVEAHYRACMYAGVNIAGTCAGDILGKWTFTIGGSSEDGPISVGDDLWMARFLLQRVAEDFNVTVTFDPQIFPRSPTGSNLDHTQIHFSTNKIGSSPAEAQIAVRKLETQFKPKLDYMGYPADLDQRMNELNISKESKENEENPKMIQKEDGSLYLLDRRVPSNMDPYAVCEQMVRAVLF